MTQETPFGPDSPQHWIKESVALRQSGKLQAAAEACQRALALAPGNADALSNLAHALRWQGRFAEASDAARKAIDAAPRMASAWFNYAASLEGLGRREDALATYRRALEIQPDYAEAWNNLGNVLTDLKRNDEALEAYRRGVERGPDLAPLWSNLGGALRRIGRADEALAACRRATTLDPGFALGWHNLGLALRDQGQFPEALDSIQRSMAADPDYVPPPAEFGRFPVEPQRPENAAACYRTALAAMSRAARAGDVESALGYEALLYQTHVQAVETEEHYARCFADWTDDLAALGRRFYETPRPAQCQIRRIAFVLHAGYVLGHTEVLFKMLESLRVQPAIAAYPRIYVMKDYDTAFVDRARQLGVETVLAEDVMPGGPDTPVLGRFLWLREHLKNDGFCTAVWVSSPLWAIFAFSMRLAPVQIFWALRFHPVSGPYIDGHITYGASEERERVFGKQAWRVCPVPLTIDATLQDSDAILKLRSQFPQGFLMGTLARAEKINSKPFLEAVAQILKDNPQAGYLWTGRSRHSDIQEFFRAQRVADRCHFVGWVDTALYASALDLFLECFPLGCGVTGYQALGAGTPVLSYYAENTIFGMRFQHEFETGSKDARSLAAGTSPPPGVERYPVLCARTQEEYVRLANRLIADPEFRRTVAARGKAFFGDEVNTVARYSRRFFDTIEDIAAQSLADRKAQA